MAWRASCSASAASLRARTSAFSASFGPARRRHRRPGRHAVPQAGHAQGLGGGEVLGRDRDPLPGGFQLPLGFDKVLLGRLICSGDRCRRAEQEQYERRPESAGAIPPSSTSSASTVPLILEPEPTGPYLAISFHRACRFVLSTERRARPGRSGGMDGSKRSGTVRRSSERRAHAPLSWLRTEGM